MRVLTSVFLLGFVLLLGCTTKEEGGTEEEAAPAKSYAEIEEMGTAKMVAVLDSIRVDARRRPMEYYYLNDQRAEALREKVKTDASKPRKRELRFQYVRELLFAGDTETAIRELEALLQGDSVRDFQTTPTTKSTLTLLAAAYLQIGIQEHCVDERSVGSCIIPIRKDAVYANQKGPRSAIILYEKILSQLQTDYQSRWLLNVAYMMMGEYPDGVPEQWRIEGIDDPPDTTVRSFRNVAPELGVDHEGLSGGVSVEDFNNDGFLDILVTSYGMDDQMKLYLSDGAGGFVDRTEEAGLSGLVGGLNTVHADYNNDGYEDVFVLRGAWLGEAGRHPNSLLRNDGDGTFTDVTYEAGLASYRPTQTAVWRDFNRDGWIDLFVGNESSTQVGRVTGEGREAKDEYPSALYLNNGDGTFTNVAQQVGIDLHAHVKGAAWGDVNQDGRPDLYVSVLGGANRLYVNNGGSSMEEWRFVERAKQVGVQGPRYSFPVWFWDYNNDGRDDLFVAGYDTRYLNQLGRAMAVERLGEEGTAIFQEATRPRLYRNDGASGSSSVQAPTFTEVSGDVGLDKMLFTMGSNYGDFDNDGYQDLYLGTGAPPSTAIVPNRMFRNRAAERFEEVSYRGGFAHIQKGHAVGFGDFDNDGDQDVYSVIGGAVEGDRARNMLFKNPGRGNTWITLDLEGRSANRSAIGARIRLVATTAEGNRRVIHRTVSTGGSFGASSLRQEIGLGTATHVDTLRVAWPNRSCTVDTYTDVEVNQHLKVVEGRTDLKTMTRATVSLGESEKVSAAPQ